jgi:tRNA nucleotidyltransferase/poly(A) polymerase
MIIKKFKLFLESNENMWDIIPDSVKDLHSIFIENGKKLYVVGGAVRDFLMKQKPKDFDLATDAKPDEIIEILKKNNYKFNLQGKEFGVVVVYTSDNPEGFEIATFREDLYDNDKLGKTRNPSVKFSTIEDDVKRRDLGINGLFYDLNSKEVVDLVGGVEQIKSKTISMIGDPNLRIKEDPLRILRAIRSACKFGKDAIIDEKTKKAILENGDKLKIISKERVWEEFKKSFNQSKDFIQYLTLLKEFNLFSYMFEDSNINTDFKISNDLELILVNLFKDNDINTLYNTMVLKYKIESDLVKKVIFLIRLFDFKPELVYDIYKLKQQSSVSNDLILKWIKLNEIENKWMIKFLDYTPFVSSKELMDKGFKGVELGKEIKRLEIENFKKTA